MRYAIVAASAQALSYGVFAVLVVFVLASQPQLALVVGSAIAALFSYNGQALFAFRPHRGATAPRHRA
jgi:putative flippase GtrA